MSAKEGGFKLKPEETPKVSSTYWAIHALRILGSKIQKTQQCRRWISNCQTEGGGFVSNPQTERKPEVWFTYCAIYSLKLLAQ